MSEQKLIVSPLTREDVKKLIEDTIDKQASKFSDHLIIDLGGTNLNDYHDQGGPKHFDDGELYNALLNTDKIVVFKNFEFDNAHQDYAVVQGKANVVNNVIVCNLHTMGDDGTAHNLFILFVFPDGSIMYSEV